MSPRLYVIRCSLKGDFYREQGAGEARGTWHERAAEASQYLDKAAAMKGLAALRAKFRRRHQGTLEIVPLAEVSPATMELWGEAA